MARVSMIFPAAFAMTFLWVGQATTTTTDAGATTAAGTTVAGTTVAGTTMAGGTTAAAGTAAPTAEVVTGSFTLAGINYADLSADTQQTADVTSAVASSIATGAGTGISSSMVSVELSAGSVQVDYSITLPSGVTGSSVSSSLTTANGDGSLLSSLSSSIGAISGLTLTGSLGVSGFSAEVNVVTTTIAVDMPSDKASHSGVSILSAVALAVLVALRA
jgi:hypothetical protein